MQPFQRRHLKHGSDSPVSRGKLARGPRRGGRDSDPQNRPTPLSDRRREQRGHDVVRRLPPILRDALGTLDVIALDAHENPNPRGLIARVALHRLTIDMREDGIELAGSFVHGDASRAQLVARDVGREKLMDEVRHRDRICGSRPAQAILRFYGKGRARS
jgi:hypothetical protein